MPRGDGTGPMGIGPMTGRGAGPCAGFAAAGHAHSMGYAGGFGCGFGAGRGLRKMFRATGLPGWARYGYCANDETGGDIPDERTLLSNQATCLREQLKQVEKRLSRLKEEEE